MHATHTVHAVPDLHVATGRLRDGSVGVLLVCCRANAPLLAQQHSVRRRQLRVQSILLGDSYRLKRVNLRRV